MDFAAQVLANMAKRKAMADICDEQFEAAKWIQKEARERLDLCNYSQLRSEAKSFGASTGGSKANLRDRLELYVRRWGSQIWAWALGLGVAKSPVISALSVRPSVRPSARPSVRPTD